MSIICERGLTCLIVTHDTQQAARMATHVMVLEAGRLVKYAPVEEELNA